MTTKISFHLGSSIIYQYSCPNACGSGYIGMTARNLYMRIGEHAGKSFRTGNAISTPVHSTISDHNITCLPSGPDNVNINNFKILYSCNSTYDLTICESLHIHKIKPQLNNTVRSYPLFILG